MTATTDSKPKIPFSQYRELLVKYLAPQRRLVFSLAVVLLANLGLQLGYLLETSAEMRRLWHGDIEAEERAGQKAGLLD